MRWDIVVAVVVFGVAGCCCPPSKATGGSSKPAPTPTSTEGEPDVSASSDIRQKMREGYCVGSKCASWYDQIKTIEAKKTSGGKVNVLVETSLYPKNSSQGNARMICTTIRESLPNIHRVSVRASDTRLIAYTSWDDPRKCDVRDMD
jgi:hypothetical protein